MGTLPIRLISALVVFGQLKSSSAINDTPVLHKAVEQLNGWIDPSVNPCDNFYQFACGGFQSKHEIPAGRKEISRLTMLQENVQQEMAEMLKSAGKPGESNAKQMVRHVYKTCLETKAKTLIDVKTMQQIFSNTVNTSWPMLGGTWNPADFDLTRLLAAVAYRATPIIKAIATPGAELLLDDDSECKIGLTFGDANNSEELQAKNGEKVTIPGIKSNVIEKLKELANEAGYEVSEEGLIADVKDVFAFEQRVLTISKSFAEFDASVPIKYHKLTDLDMLFPKVEWRRYFELAVPSETGSFFNEFTYVLVANDALLQRLNALIEDTDPKVITNYIIWRYAYSFYVLIPGLYGGGEEPYMHLEDLEVDPHKCVRLVQELFGKGAYGSLYAATFLEATRSETNKIADQLMKSFLQVLKDAQWMDDVTRYKAVEKLEGIKRFVGYPDWLLDDAKLNLRHDSLHFSPSEDLVTSMDKMHRNNWNYNIKSTFNYTITMLKRSEFDPTVANAFYSSMTNSISFPAALLQPPYFSSDFPAVLNFGAVGSIVGHEITHGFDSSGRYYNTNGTQHNWWKEETSQLFEEKAKCFIDQYSAVKIPELGKNINGKLTLAENIADNGGIKAAFLAYKEYAKNHADDKVPGVEYSNDQIFFIAFAQNWCQKLEPTERDLVETHAPNHVRILKTVSNTKAFGDAFNCPRGAQMDPVEKCVIW